VGRIEHLKNRCLESRQFSLIVCHGFYAKTHAKSNSYPTF